MSKSNTSMQIADSSVAWVQWLEQVGVEDREATAQLLAEHDTSSFEGLVQLQKGILIQVLTGRISPVILDSIQPLLRDMMTNLYTIHKDQGNSQEVVAFSVRRNVEELVAAVKPVSMRITQSSGDQIRAIPARDRDEDQ